jgi:hypothetical protein
MQFRFSTLLLLFVLLGSSLAVFGWAGIAVFGLLALLALRIGRPWLVLSCLLGLLLFVVGLLPAISAAREAAKLCTCHCPMKQLVLALHNYNQQYGCFPPAYIADKNGRPLHSWRALILPEFGDYDYPFQKYKYDEPWDGPNNKKLLAARPMTFVCPNDEDAFAPGATQTSYAAVLGANAAWPGEKPRRFADFGPAASSTIMLVEVTGAGIAWTEPSDLNLDLLGSPSNRVTVSSHHFPNPTFFFRSPPAGVNVALADGSVRFLLGELLEAHKWSDLLQIGGLREEYFKEDYSIPDRPIHWPNCIALAVWLASVAVLMSRAIQARRKRSADSRAGEGTPDNGFSANTNTAARSGETPLPRDCEENTDLH